VGVTQTKEKTAMPNWKSDTIRAEGEEAKLGAISFAQVAFAAFHLPTGSISRPGQQADCQSAAG
jgi:hypothetical protein